MYSNPHAAVGLAITTTTLLITNDINMAYGIGLPIAVASHYYMDFLKEGHLGKDVFKYDIVPSWFYYGLAFISGYFWLFFFSWIAGNLLDIIDKKGYLAIFFPKKFKASHYFHTQKKGIPFTVRQTKSISIFSSIVILFITLILMNR